jgi:hypothetical protein
MIILLALLESTFSVLLIRTSFSVCACLCGGLWMAWLISCWHLWNVSCYLAKRLTTDFDLLIWCRWKEGQTRGRATTNYHTLGQTLLLPLVTNLLGAEQTTFQFLISIIQRLISTNSRHLLNVPWRNWKHDFDLRISSGHCFNFRFSCCPLRSLT